MTKYPTESNTAQQPRNKPYTCINNEMVMAIPGNEHEEEPAHQEHERTCAVRNTRPRFGNRPSQGCRWIMCEVCRPFVHIWLILFLSVLHPGRLMVGLTAHSRLPDEQQFPLNSFGPY